MSRNPRTALVGEVSPRLAEAELTFIDREPVDVDLARRQHAAYRELLVELGLAVVEVAAAADHPDAVFVEDVVVVVGGELAVLTRPGAASRRGEVARMELVVAARNLPTAAIEAPASLDGGDVLQVDGTVYVGLSTRTNRDGIEQLRRLVTPLGRRVVPVPVDRALHLKTAATALPDGRIVAQPGWVDPASFEGREVVAAPEPTGANLLVVGDRVAVSASAPATAELVAGLGYEVATTDIGEFEKAEAGLTCLSVLVP